MNSIAITINADGTFAASKLELRYGETFQLTVTKAQSELTGHWQIAFDSDMIFRDSAEVMALAEADASDGAVVFDLNCRTIKAAQVLNGRGSVLVFWQLRHVPSEGNPETYAMGTCRFIGAVYDEDAEAESTVPFRALLDLKQDKLTAGRNIQISPDNVISANDASEVDVHWNNVLDKPDAYPPESHVHPTSQITGLDTALTGITSKIPQSATAQNKLVTASQMGEAIEAVEARQLYATATQGSFATHAALTSATSFYLANGSETTPTKNDVAYVLTDETHSGKSAKYTATFVDDALTWGFVITFSDNAFNQAQMDAINSKATEEKIAKIETAVQESQRNVAGGFAGLNTSGIVSSDNLPKLTKSTTTGYGLVQQLPDGSTGVRVNESGYIMILTASNNEIDDGLVIKVVNPTNLKYAVRSVLPLITTIPAATSAYTLLAQDATTNNHSYTYVHAPAEAPTYTLPSVTATTVSHVIFLTVDMANTASVMFQDSEGTVITPSLAGGTPAVGDVWQFMCEYSTVHSKWLVLGYKED